jgi:arabinose-5-phosphate isomerase
MEAAGRVLRLEAEGLACLAGSLDQTFSRALDALQMVDGRIVVTGMGKSGHIANKIAATLASTGSPAFFVHPGEASHGDLGMIGQTDAVLALSNSGETPEISDIVAYTRRFKIPLVVITSGPESSLAQQADVALVLPEGEEACPMGLAPTTSTTMMIALGDSLAVALMERRGFTADDFKLRHPGGQLARRLLKVSDIMHQGAELPLVSGTTPMSQTLVEMTAKSFGCVAVVDARNRIEGIITDGDLRRHMTSSLLDNQAAQVMTRAPRTISPSALASQAVQIMNEIGITNLFVTEDDRVIGVLHIHDCLRMGVA